MLKGEFESTLGIQGTQSGNWNSDSQKKLFNLPSRGKKKKGDEVEHEDDEDDVARTSVSKTE